MVTIQRQGRLQVDCRFRNKGLQLQGIRDSDRLLQGSKTKSSPRRAWSHGQRQRQRQDAMVSINFVEELLNLVQSFHFFEVLEVDFMSRWMDRWNNGTAPEYRWIDF
jgi:hypothetical protein